MLLEPFQPLQIYCKKKKQETALEFLYTLPTLRDTFYAYSQNLYAYRGPSNPKVSCGLSNNNRALPFLAGSFSASTVISQGIT